MFLQAMSNILYKNMAVVTVMSPTLGLQLSTIFVIKPENRLQVPLNLNLKIFVGLGISLPLGGKTTD